MAKRVDQYDQADIMQRPAELVRRIEEALEEAAALNQHRTAAALDDALIHAHRAANQHQSEI